MQDLTEEDINFISKNVRKQVGEQIQKYRKLKNYTQTELALMVGKDRQYLYKIEKGKVTPNITTISTLAFVLEISLATLFENVTLEK